MTEVSLLCTRAPRGRCQQKLTGARRASRGEGHSPYSISHGHPEKTCQQKLTGARRASRGEGHSPYSISHGHPEKTCQQKLTGARRASRGEGRSPTRLRLIDMCYSRLTLPLGHGLCYI